LSKGKRKRQNVGIVTGPIVSEAGNVVLSNLADLLGALFSNVYVITANEGVVISRKYKRKTRLLKVYHKSGANIFSRVIKYVYLQLRISYKLARLARSVDIWVFLFGATLVLPVLSAKLLRKKVVLALTGNVHKEREARKDPLFQLLALSEDINGMLSDRIIIYSERFIAEQGLQKYRGKISIAHEHFVDFSTFRILKPLLKRKNVVGYIGRLGREKGILRFLEAVLKVSLEREDVTFLIGGGGELQDKVEEYLSLKNLGNRVKFVGWIPHNEIPAYLNQLKLFVLPSYTEGLPNIVLEAMACGTPVLTTPVGAIPDVIKHEETGFIMEDNSPECIARNIVRALAHRDLEQITMNARAAVEKEYSYTVAMEGYRKALVSID
jgi:glycosyltransferase involved in cell wall biosynthesis